MKEHNVCRIVGIWRILINIVWVGKFQSLCGVDSSTMLRLSTAYTKHAPDMNYLWFRKKYTLTRKKIVGKRGENVILKVITQRWRVTKPNCVNNAYITYMYHFFSLKSNARVAFSCQKFMSWSDLKWALTRNSEEYKNLKQVTNTFLYMINILFDLLPSEKKTVLHKCKNPQFYHKKANHGLL